MKESVALAKEADAKKEFSPTSKSIHRVRNEQERQLGSLRSVIEAIRSDGGTPSVDSIATELSSTHTAQRAPVLLALQQTHGNRYVQRVVAGIQAKLAVGQPGDIYEQEAERVAEEVMRMKLARTLRNVDQQIKRSAVVRGDIEEEVSQEFLHRVESQRGAGQPLGSGIRSEMEAAFGYDFGDVRLHTDSEAQKTAIALGARAFTFGRDIWFGRKEPSSDKKLLAHELTHVVQQDAVRTIKIEDLHYRSHLQNMKKRAGTVQFANEKTPAKARDGRERDSRGRRLHSSGIWDSNTTLSVQGGQGMHFAVNNRNILGTTIRITANTGESHESIIPPRGTVHFNFAYFTGEPMSWRFDIRTESDVFFVRWKLYSTWIPGDPPNRLGTG